MDIETRIDLIARNTAEIVSEEELRSLLETNDHPRIYHGFEPTGGIMQIGYLLATQKHIDFQKAGLELNILFADLHAWLNEKGTLEEIAKIAEKYKRSFAAAGVDIQKANCVMGSSFQLAPEYFKNVMKLSLLTRMTRAKRAMTIIGREEENPHVAQVLYPLMQAIDIHELSDIAFGDLAQRKIHMLARENFPTMGWKPPVAIHHVDMVGLTGGKMSSSDPKTVILLNEEPDIIRKKISNAYCPTEEENNPLLEISRYIILPMVGELNIERSKKYGGDVSFNNYSELKQAYISKKLHAADLKAGVAETLINLLAPMKAKIDKGE